MRIFYVDDDIEDIEIFRDAVNTVNPAIQCISAQSGLEALDFLQGVDTLPDHIILDINMPGMDGKLCLQELRKKQKFDGASIVVYSTNICPKDIEYIESLGARFIRKASTFNDLCAILRKLEAEKL